jgi:uncharacterized membrane protein YdjX (TVP38/TMEM64 family)
LHSSDQKEALSKVSREKRLLIFALLMVVAVIVSMTTPLRDILSVDDLRARALALGPWAPLAIIVVGALGPSLFLPRWPIAFVSGFLYGVGTGTLLGNFAGALGALVHFFVALHLLAPSARAMCRKRNIDIDRIPKDKAFLVIFMLRAFPFSSTVVTNLVAGALKMNVRSYFTATFLGMIPSSLIYAASGSLINESSNTIYFAIGGGLMTFVIVGWFGRRTLRSIFVKEKQPDNSPES